MKKGILVMVDGIDGSGKGTIINALADWARKNDLKVLDLKKYWQKYHSFPEEKDIRDYDCLISAEPTFSMVGQAIREEMIKDNGRQYSTKTIAEAFSLDREILYKRIVLPALAQGKYVFQERGVTTSLVYQPIHKETIALEEVMSMSGNQFALSNRPDLLIITLVEPEEALRRLAQRDKKDNVIFEKLPFLIKAAERFSSPWFRQIFEERGSNVHYLETNKSVYDTIKESLNIWKNFIQHISMNG